MTSNRKERLALVTKRLEDELVQQNDFFHSCCELALGCKISEESHAYLSYRVCRETLGHKNGVYLCLLYAQLYAANCLLTTYGSQIDEQLRDEFTCVNRELLSQILLMTDLSRYVMHCIGFTVITVNYLYSCMRYCFLIIFRLHLAVPF